jgi:hypothetical protein
MTRYLFHHLDCVPAAVRDRPRYVGDHVIRHYRPLGLAQLLADLGADPATPDLVIVGGIGRLVLRSDGSETWEPTLPDAPLASLALRPSDARPRSADPAVVAIRVAQCSQCDAHAADRCTASGCGCAGEGKPEVWSSRCPLGRWPS